ncbi:hypothetical protein LY474_36095 [Myxococcus stipitatus]|uniref:hypothetical protein n=1 Tax=Myxococcus stipitatus TaxID=83455 RepID=UPI001F3C8B3C|nr:hypothetical protein [Myxococcus stipitatus]MCE9673243.1 hypothetical protein [Myxococcus stipitatus]
MVLRWRRLAVRSALVSGLLLGSMARSEGGGTPAFQLVERKPRPAFGTEPFSSRVKSFEEGAPARMMAHEVVLDGRTLLIPGLSGLTYDSERRRLINHGQSLWSHVAGASFAYRIYSTEGKLLRSLGELSVGPFAKSVSADGSFSLAGRSPEEGKGEDRFVALFDRDANPKWRTPLTEPGFPSEIAHAPDGGAVAVLVNRLGTGMSGRLLVYDEVGMLMAARSRSPSTVLAFTRDRKLVLCDVTSWEVLDARNGLQKVARGVMAGDRLDAPAILPHPSKDVFILTSRADKSVVLQAFRGADGTLLAQSRFPATEQQHAPERLRFDRDGTLRLDVDGEVLVLRLPEG